MKKYLILLLSLSFITACGKKYDTVDTEVEAAKVNAETAVEVKEQVAAVPGKVFFDLDSYSLKATERQTLNRMAEWLDTKADAKVTVEGHCDERGTREYNLALGQKRADSVKKYLVSRGVRENRIKTISYGKEKPEFLGKGEEIWSKNRRAAIIINKSK
ncbi:MAG: peptidoglycan-associated lipoprotein Pal [Rickettsiales bacterium]|jgi:peptidoglycan-associated lipoprotein|nr:peptidoglycan-associated lipoprotein Pal [Rickettsiales bacterium]